MLENAATLNWIDSKGDNFPQGCSKFLWWFMKYFANGQREAQKETWTETKTLLSTPEAWQR